jgi:hypothetical protein
MRYTNGEQRYIHNDEVTFLLVRDELMKYADKSCLQGLIANAVNKEVERRLFGFTGKFCVLFWRKEDAEVVMWGRPADPTPFPDPKSKQPAGRRLFVVSSPTPRCSTLSSYTNSMRRKASSKTTRSSTSANMPQVLGTR